MKNSRLWGLILLVAFCLITSSSHLLMAQIETTGKPSKPAQPPLPTLVAGDIVSTESDALSVWRYPSSAPIWTKATSSSYYDQVAVGDVNGDGRPEIVVPVSKQLRGKGGQLQFKIFVEVYKEGSGTSISSENYSPGYFMDGSRVICDVMVADVIPEVGTPINEIVLQHWYNLTIFRWDGTNFRIMTRIKARFQDLPVAAYNGTTTKDVDGNGVEEIFASGQNEIYGEYWGIGYVYRIDMMPGGTYLLNEVASTKNCQVARVSIGHRLRLADLDGDGVLEICLPGSVSTKQNDVTYRQAYLLVLDDGLWNYALLPGYELAKAVYPYIDLDVGELDPAHAGEEIALYVNQQQDTDYYLYVFNYPFGPAPISCSLLIACDIKVGDIPGLNGNEIVVCGNSPQGEKYLEAFHASLSSSWLVFGGRGSIGDLAIVK